MSTRGQLPHSRKGRVRIPVNDDAWARAECGLAQVAHELATHPDQLLGGALEVHDSDVVTVIVAVCKGSGDSNVLFRNQSYRYAVAYRTIQELADLLRRHVPLALLEPAHRRDVNLYVTYSNLTHPHSPFRHRRYVICVTVYKV